VRQFLRTDSEKLQNLRTTNFCVRMHIIVNSMPDL